MDEKVEKIYPNLREEKEINQQINESKNKDRQKIIRSKIKQLEEKFNHYKKIKNNWIKASKILRIIGISISSIAAGTAIVISIPLSLPIIAVIITGVAGGTTLINESILMGFLNKKKKYFRDKCKYTKMYLDKLSIYFEKCRDDTVITLEEMEGFNKIEKEYDNKMEFERNNFDKLLSKKDLKNTEKKAKKNLKNEKMQEHYNKTFEEYKANLN